LSGVDGDRCNVIATVPGQSEETLLFVAHLDTVPANGWSRDPFTTWVSNNRLYGRGACDTKGSLAAMLAALDSIKDQKPRATIVVAGSVDEEFRKKGARALGQTKPRFSGAVVGEPTDLEMVVAHKGSVRWQIEVLGRAAHTSMPEVGENAIEAMASVVLSLRRYGQELRTRHAPLTGAPSLTVSLIEGGSDICTVPARCVISIDRRLVPGESPAAALAEVEALLSEPARMHPATQIRSILPAAEDLPLSAATGSRLAEITRKSCQRIAGTGEPRGVPYGTDASELFAAGIPCVVIGPGSIAQAHAVDEYVDLDQLEKAFEIHREIMLSY
jgi:acetylornithine deacetylase